jgi:hypothetical protein
MLVFSLVSDKTVPVEDKIRMNRRINDHYGKTIPVNRPPYLGHTLTKARELSSQ